MATDDQPRVHTIAEGGDLILDVGQSPGQVKLLVSSNILTGASKVFTALLGPNFLEGQTARSSQSPQTISLPDDGPDGMELICELLHGTISPEELRLLTNTQLLSFATHVDKYDLSKPFQFQSQALLLAALNAFNRSYLGAYGDLVQLVAAAYLLQRSECFKMATQRLAMDVTGPWLRGSPVWDVEFPKSVPGVVFDTIEHKRIVAREKIAHEVPQLLAPRCNFGCSFSESPDLIPLLEAFNVIFWPATRLTVYEAKKGLNKLVGVEKARCSYHHSPYTAVKDGKIGYHDVLSLTQELTSICEGLCLRCVRKNNDLRKGCGDESHRD